MRNAEKVNLRQKWWGLYPKTEITGVSLRIASFFRNLGAYFDGVFVFLFFTACFVSTFFFLSSVDIQSRLHISEIFFGPINLLSLASSLAVEFLLLVF